MRSIDGKTKSILAILQNFYSNRHVGKKASEPMVKKFLLRSATGKHLREVFGDIVDSWSFGEAYPYILPNAKTVPRADQKHIQELIDRHKPTIVIAFGAVAATGVLQCVTEAQVIYLPHPSPRNRFRYRQPAVMSSCRQIMEGNDVI